MQKIQKFQFGHIYRAPKSTKTYELLDRSGHHDGVRLRSDSLLVDRKKLKRVEQIPQQGIIDLMAILAA